MYLIWLGLLGIVLKVVEVGPFGELSWWWILTPFAAALIWFEFLERPLGRDRRNAEHLEIEKRRRERVEAQFPLPPGVKRRK